MTPLEPSVISTHLPQTLGPQTPGYAFALIEGDEVQTLCQGMANLEHQVEITPHTAFRIASVTKHFLALVAQIYFSRGKFDLDAPMGEYLPELSGVQAEVTSRQALQNCSGIRDHLELTLMAGGGLNQTVSVAQSLGLILQQQETNFRAGTDFLYSNANFLLVTIALQRATGSDLGALLHDELFGPNGMSATRYVTGHGTVVPDLATGYIDRGDHFERGAFATELTGEGAIISTLSDLVRWCRYLRNDPHGHVAEISRLPTFANGSKSHYAMGFFNRSYLGQATRGHNGLWPGYRTDLVLFDDLDKAAICITNVNTVDPTMLTRRVMCGLFPGKFEQPDAVPEPEALKALTDGSIFLNNETLEHASFSQEVDGLGVEIGGWKATHRYSGPTEVVFSLPSDYLKLDWSEVELGNVTLTKTNGVEVTLIKCPAMAEDASSSFVGTYRCPYLQSTLTINQDEDGAKALIRGSFAFGETWTVVPITAEICRMTDASGPWPRQLTCRLVDDGRALLISGGRVKRMRFDRVEHAVTEAAA